MNTRLGNEIKQVVVFDTNAYRRLAHRSKPEEASRRAENLVAAERRAGVQALASPVVLLELLAHLADPEDPNYQVCRSAVCGAVRHCSMVTESGDRHIAICLSTDAQLCKSLWQTIPENISSNDDFIRAVALRVSDDPAESALDRFRGVLRGIAAKLAASERQFAEGTLRHRIANFTESARELGFDGDVKDLRAAYLAYLDTDAASEAVARAHVLRAQDKTVFSESPSQIAEKARFVVRHLNLAIRLYLEMTKKIVESDWDLTRGKGGNILWDMQIAFFIGEQHTFDGRPGRVVTGDRTIRDVAGAAGMRRLVLDYSDYRDELVPQ